MPVKIEVGNQYRLREGALVEVTDHQLGASVTYKVVDPAPLPGNEKVTANMTEDEFLQYAQDPSEPKAAAAVESTRSTSRARSHED